MDLKRKRPTVKEKVEALERIEKGESLAAIASDMNVSERSLFYWKKQRLLLEDVKYAPNKDTIISRTKVKVNIFTEVLRERVYEWFLDQRGKGAPMTQSLVSAKAIEVNKTLGGPPDFAASNGWIDRFKKAYGIHQMNGILSTAENLLAEKYRAKFISQMTASGLSTHQVYNADETGLYFKCMPNKSLEAGNLPAQEFKQSKDRVTLLVCCNGSGDHKLPLLVIGKSNRPRAFLNVNKAELPAVYMHSSRALMTSNLFQAWVRDEFEPKVKAYLTSKNLPLVAWLLVDSAPSHSLTCVTVGIVTIKFFPSNLNSLIPLDQGAIALLKRAYRKELLEYLIKSADIFKEIQKIDILVALEQAASAWSKIQPDTLAKCWKCLGLNKDSTKERFVTAYETKQVEDEIIYLSSRAGFGTALNQENIAQWCDEDPLDVHSDGIDDENPHVKDEPVNPDRSLKTDTASARISHKEGAVVLDRAVLYLRQIGKNDLANSLSKERDCALKRKKR